MQPRQLAGTVGLDSARSAAEGLNQNQNQNRTEEKYPDTIPEITSDAQSATDFIDQGQTIVHLSDR